MENNYKVKRASLENFVKEQIIGPGAYHKKYFFTADEIWKKSEFYTKNINTSKAIDNTSELIPEVPAYQYSSGILFPIVKQAISEDSPKIIEVEENENEFENENNGVKNESADDDNLIDKSDEKVVLKQQNYPNSFGLTFVIGKNNNIQRDIKISFSGRTYNNISKKELIQNGVAINIPEYKDDIEVIIIKYFSEFFTTKNIDDNLFLVPIQQLDKEFGNKIDYDCFNNFVKEIVLRKINKAILNIEVLDKKNETQYFGVKNKETYSPQFYSLSSVKHGYKDVYTIFDDSLNTFILTNLKKDKNSFQIFRDLIKTFEIYQQVKQHILDLKSIISINKTPVWQSKPFKTTIKLPEIDLGKKIQRSKPEKLVFNTEVASTYLEEVSFTSQYITKDDKVYVKLMVSNENIFELNSNEAPQLNKKDKVNIKTLFGCEINVSETLSKCLLKYNPPQMLEGDDEDNFNKLLYRNFIDLGEGYNTSVNWGKNSQGFNYIVTDFLPSQETPKVGYKPSEIDNGKVIPLIEGNTLSMRYLSTLSDVSDIDVLKILNNFVDAYYLWINKKRIALDIEKQENPALNNELLKTELNACEKDYKRLKRNIGLLEKTENAMAAFRTMNTAMFMQLHHSLNVNNETPFIPKDKNYEGEDYYKNVSLDRDYAWRSFQLAFIILNIDAFVKPVSNDNTVEDVFETGWPERNEVADLVWFPTGGGKTEAYLGIIAFTIALRRFTKGEKSYGTTVLMRYTLRMLTLQQFQRATLLILALETIRKDDYRIPKNYTLGDDRISIGLFVGGDTLPNYWDKGDNSMLAELKKISGSIKNNTKLESKLPFTDCPWCGGDLFVNEELPNVSPNHTKEDNKYNTNTQLNISCNSKGCTYHNRRPSESKSLPLRLFDEDIYKYPPTLLFGTVDKFAALANKASTASDNRNQDSRRLVGKGYLNKNQDRDVLPPELIIQDELHLLLGPLGSSVGLYEKSIDYLCTYNDEDGSTIKPKIVTSTATTRNTDKQIFALFNRRTEIFPKQGILCDDSFFSFYERDENNIEKYNSQRRYLGVLPIGKTQVWMQLRIISICLAHRLKYFKEQYQLEEVFENPKTLNELKKVFDYYHTVLSYYNSLKDVGKAQSQLTHYLPGDLNYVIKNTIPFSFLDLLIRDKKEIDHSELTGRLSAEEVKTNLSDIEKTWSLFNENQEINLALPPEFIIATNMISVGIDVSRFNTIVINSMPRNIAEYIQASSRVARNEDGIVFTIHHPFRSRDISHYQKFKEFHEKFYSYVEPISVTPFANKALDRYLAMYVTVIVRHNKDLGLTNNKQAKDYNNDKAKQIKAIIIDEIKKVYKNSEKLEAYLLNREDGLKSTVDGIISEEEIEDVRIKLDEFFNIWEERLEGTDEQEALTYRTHQNDRVSLFKDLSSEGHWKVTQSLREIGETSVIKTVQQ
jgi:hypothetical protein